MASLPLLPLLIVNYNILGWPVSSFCDLPSLADPRQGSPNPHPWAGTALLPKSPALVVGTFPKRDDLPD